MVILSRGSAQCRLELAGKIFHGYFGTQTALQYFIYHFQLENEKKEEGQGGIFFLLKKIFIVDVLHQFLVFLKMMNEVRSDLVYAAV